MGVRQAVGEGPVRLAHRAAGKLHRDAAGRVGDARQRTGHSRRTAAQELAAAVARSIKQFYVFALERSGNDSTCDLQSNLLVTSFDPQARIAALERELAWAHLKIQALSEELRQQRVKLLGPRSETLSDLQLELLADEEPGTTLDEVEAEARRAPLPDVPPRQRRSHPGRQRLPENLPRVEQIVACAEQTCRQCGATTAVIGYDESEQLDVEPARYFVRVMKREKRACRRWRRAL